MGSECEVGTPDVSNECEVGTLSSLDVL